MRSDYEVNDRIQFTGEKQTVSMPNTGILKFNISHGNSTAWGDGWAVFLRVLAGRNANEGSPIVAQSRLNIRP
jgi:hypothetical protein